MRYSLLVVLLAGCAATVPPPPVVNTVEVKVPVLVPCKVSLPAAPVWELSRTSADASLFELAKAAVIEIRQRIAYETELLAAMKACE